MRSRFTTLSSDLTIDDFVREQVMASDQQIFPVVSADGVLLGMIGLNGVQETPRAEWRRTRIVAIMTPADELASLAATDSAAQAFDLLAKSGADQLVVLQDRRPIGLVNGHDLLKWIALNMDSVEEKQFPSTSP